jgi:hypothetical protein
LLATVVAACSELLPCQAWVVTWVKVDAPLAVQPLVPPPSKSPLVTKLLELKVSTFSKLAAEEFWTWKAVVELEELAASTEPVNLLLPVNVWGPVPFKSATFELKRASLRVPLETLLALRLVNPAPLPVKLLDALLKVLLPVNVWLPFSLARLESLDSTEEDICTPLSSYWPPLATLMLAKVGLEVVAISCGVEKVKVLAGQVTGGVQAQRPAGAYRYRTAGIGNRDRVVGHGRPGEYQGVGE